MDSTQLEEDVTFVVPSEGSFTSNANHILESVQSAGDRIANLSKKVGELAAGTYDRTAENFQRKSQERKDKKEAKREEKISTLQSEISDEEPIEDELPPMIILPEFEQERMAIVKEQQAHNVQVVEHLLLISTRIDEFQDRYVRLQKEQIRMLEEQAQMAEQFSIMNGLKRASTFLGLTVFMIIIASLIQLFFHKSTFEIYSVSLETIIWSLTFLLWSILAMEVLKMQTPNEILPIILEITAALSFAIGSGVIHHIFQDTVYLAIIGLFSISVAFTSILAFAAIGPVHQIQT